MSTSKTKAVSVLDKPVLKYNGRPPKFNSVEELQEQITNYFNECQEAYKPPTITGLAFMLNTTRDVLMDYEKYNVRFKEFSSTIKRAKQYIHMCLEERLYTTGAPAGVIFGLKNNYGWKDIQTVEGAGSKQSFTNFTVNNYIVNNGDNVDNKCKEIPSTPIVDNSEE